MSVLLTWLSFVAYAVPMVPAAARVARATADRGRCHHEDRNGGRDPYPHGTRSWCTSYHRPECWRSADQVELRDLRYAATAIAWPLLLLAAVVLHEANRKPSRRMLEARIERLELENGVTR